MKNLNLKNLNFSGYWWFVVVSSVDSFSFGVDFDAGFTVEFS